MLKFIAAKATNRSLYPKAEANIIKYCAIQHFYEYRRIN